MVFDNKGNLYVTDETNSAVFMFSSNGIIRTFADASDGLKAPEGIVFHNNHLYLTDNGVGAVFKFSLDGTGEKILTFTRNYRDLQGIAFDDENNLYVVAADFYVPNNFIFKIENIDQ